MPLTKTIDAFIDLSPEEVGDHCHVRVEITPMAQNQDLMARAQLAQAFRTPGVDGKALADDLTIVEKFFPDWHPGTIAERLRAMTLPARSQEIGKIELAADEQEWMDNNKDRQKLAEKRLNPNNLPDLSPENAQMMLRFQELIKNGADVNVLMQALQMAEGGNGQMPMLPAPGGGGPMPVDPSISPAQMTMTPEDALPNPVTLPGKQARRGKPAN